MSFQNQPESLIVPELAKFLASEAFKKPYPDLFIDWLNFSDTHAPGDAPSGAVEVALITHDDTIAYPKKTFDINVRLLISDSNQAALLQSLANAHSWLTHTLQRLGKKGLTPQATFDGKPVILFRGLQVTTSRWTPRWAPDRSGTGAVLVACRLPDPAFTTTGGMPNALVGWGFGN